MTSPYFTRKNYEDKLSVQDQSEKIPIGLSIDYNYSSEGPSCCSAIRQRKHANIPMRRESCKTVRTKNMSTTQRVTRFDQRTRESPPSLSVSFLFKARMNKVRLRASKRRQQADTYTITMCDGLHRHRKQKKCEQ